MATSTPQNNLRKLGKAQARQQFAPLVEALASAGGVVEITDYGKVAAVMLGYKDYLWLLAQSGNPFKPKRQLAGSAILAGDLDKVSKETTESVLDAIDKSAQQL